MNTPTSASDRYAEARAALARHEACFPDKLTDHLYLALRSLITPPVTDETPQSIVNDIDARYITAAVATDDTSLDVRITWAGLNAALLAAVHAGIDAAWESWEPENAPGLVSDPLIELREWAAKAAVCLREEGWSGYGEMIAEYDAITEGLDS